MDNFKDYRHYQLMRRTGQYGNPNYWGWLSNTHRFRAKFLTGLLPKKKKFDKKKGL